MCGVVESLASHNRIMQVCLSYKYEAIHLFTSITEPMISFELVSRDYRLLG